MQCYYKVIKPAMFDGHKSLEEFRSHKESLTQIKKRKMAESSQQRKHIANTLLRKGRIDRLNAKLKEGQEEERSKFERLKIEAMMVPDGHVDTESSTVTIPQLTNGTNETSNANNEVDAKESENTTALAQSRNENQPIVTTVEEEDEGKG